MSGQDVGPFGAALTELAAAALTEPDADGLCLVHPPSPASGAAWTAQPRSSPPRPSWSAGAISTSGRSQTAATVGLAAHFAASTVPYLMRLNRREEASAACELAINHDGSPDMAARLGTYAVESSGQARVPRWKRRPGSCTRCWHPACCAARHRAFHRPACLGREVRFPRPDHSCRPLAGCVSRPDRSDPSRPDTPDRDRGQFCDRSDPGFRSC